MNTKKYICLAGLLLPLTAMAQQDKTLCDFESEDSYVSVRAYDPNPTSLFNTNHLTGNVKVINNDLNEVDATLGFAPNGSEKMLGVQRSRYGSNTFGALVELKEPFALKRTTQYVHIKMYTDVDSPVMLIGMGRRDDRPWQPATTQQFWSVPTSNLTAGSWQDIVFPINGADGITISNLLVVVDRQSAHNYTSDHAVFVDDIVLSTKSSPSFSASNYPINYEESTTHTRTDRYVNNVGLTTPEGTETLSISQNSDKKLYFKKLDNCFKAKPGESVTATISWTGVWMHGYAYLDKDDNGKFDVDYDDNGLNNANELMAFSYFKEKNSNNTTVSGDCGVGMPSFTIPSDLTPGIYRMRYKVDWDCVDPGGNIKTGNLITSNGGAIIDTRINIHNDNVNVYRATEENGGGLNGEVLMSDGQPVTGRTTPFGQAFKIKAQPAVGFTLDYMKIRHGYNLEGASTKHENKQWEEFTVQASQFTNGEYTIPANCVDGDIRIVPFFKSDPTAVNSVEDTKAFRVETSKGTITLHAAQPTSVSVADVNGHSILHETVEGIRTLNVHKGVYIVNGDKVLVK